MFGANLLVFVAVLSATVMILHAAAVPVKRSVLEDSVIALLKDEEKNDRNFQSTVLKTMKSFQNQLEDIRNKSVGVKNMFENNDLNEKLSTSLERILDKLYCPNQFRYVEHSCFKISNESVDWKTANATCLQGNSHLVSVDSSDTRHAALRSLVGDESLRNDGFIWAERNTTGKDMHSTLDSNLLTSNHRTLLNKWLPGKQFRLLYRATRDGMTPSSFHRKCDGKGATLSIGKDFTSNTTFGGYSSVSWTSVDSYKRDSNAFVFRLCRQGCTSANYSHSQYQYQYQHYAVSHYSRHGPGFGVGYDLKFFTGKRTYDSTNKYFPTDGYCSRSGSYTYTSNLGCGDNVKWTDVEVWSVVDATAVAATDAATGDCLALNLTNQKLERKPCTDKARYICEL